MKAFGALATIAITALASAGLSPASAQVSGPAPLPVQERAEALESTLARWQESLDLDLSAEVLNEGLSLVRREGTLTRNARAVALVARALSSAGRALEARDLLEGAAPAQPTELIAAERARLALDEDDLEGVLALLWDADAKAMRTPAANDAWLLAGRARARRGEWDQAVPLLERYLVLEPRSSEAAGAWHLLALDALRRMDTPRTRECAQREEALGRWHSYYRARRLQVRENPREPLPRLGLAQLWLEANDLPRAKAVLDELLALAPDFARGWMALGETQRKQNDLAGARASYDRALGLDPSLDIARYNRAVIARLEARDGDARLDLEVLLGGAAGRDARFASAHLDLARLYVKAKDAERAAAAFARYQALGGKEKL